MYYMSMEFLMGRSLTNALNALDVVDPYMQSLRDMGCVLDLPAGVRNIRCLSYAWNLQQGCSLTETLNDMGVIHSYMQPCWHRMCSLGRVNGP